MQRRGTSLMLFLLMASVLLCSSAPVTEGDNQAFSASLEPSISEYKVDEVLDSSRNLVYQNLGQMEHPDVLYYASTPGLLCGFAKGRVLLWIYGEMDPVELLFIGARSVSPIGIEDAGHSTNIFLGNVESFVDVRGFDSLIYEDLWKGVDLIYCLTDEGVKYEFYVHPNGNPNDIVLKWRGQDNLEVERTSLRISKDDSILIDDGLTVFQEDSGVNARFVENSDNSIGFRIDAYDRSKTLVIDPLLYATYLGGNFDDRGGNPVIGPDGDIYVLVYCGGGGFTTVGALNYSYNGGTSDIVLCKIDSTCSRLIYSTYLGGVEQDWATAMKIDASGNWYLTGETDSPDFPYMSGFDSSLNGSKDSFVLKLDAEGANILYSTYVGGSGEDRARTIAIDTDGNAFIAGETDSTDFPLRNPVDSTFNGSRDGFIFKIDADGDEMLFSTYLGGSGYDHIYWMDTDTSGDVYVVGVTRSSDYVTLNAHDANFDGDSDCFVTKLDGDSETLEYSTFLGGSEDESGYSVVVDDGGNCYLTGFTDSADFPTLNPYQNDLGGEMDCFVAKLDSSGTLSYSTYIGGEEDDRGIHLEIDTFGCTYVVGGTSSDDFPTVNAVDSSYNGGSFDQVVQEVTEDDGFALKLDQEGDDLCYSTYIGGSGSEDLLGITIDEEQGVAYIAGMTTSDDFPDTEGGHQPEHAEEWDCIVFVLPDEGDSDNDGLSEYWEFVAGTLRANNDTDSDGMPDGWEYWNNTNPLEHTANYDHDLDGLSNIDEFHSGTNPGDIDTDDDGYDDAWEVWNGFNPLDSEVTIIQVLAANVLLIGLGIMAAASLPVVYFLRPILAKRRHGEVVLEVHEETQAAFEALKEETERLEAETALELLWELELALEQRVKPVLKARGHRPTEIDKLTIHSLTMDREDLLGIEVEAFLSLSGMVEVPPPDEIARLLKLRDSIEEEGE
ncbi:MAG: DUF7948 domain-containing protein [Candidatus Thorarchaeota archaeon]